MPEHRLLSHDEFRLCFAEPMKDVTAEVNAAFDIWPYVDSLDLDQLGIPHVNDVHNVYRDESGKFDQVLIGTGRFNTLLVIVIDRADAKIFGHHLLDLNAEFDVLGGHLKSV